MCSAMRKFRQCCMAWRSLHFAVPRMDTCLLGNQGVAHAT